MSETTQAPVPTKNGLGIAALVLGIIALLTSFLPIINNMSIIVAFVGAVLGIIGLIKISKAQGKKVFTIIALCLNVLALVIAFSAQAAFVGALDKAVDGPAVVSSNSDSNPSSNDKAQGKSSDEPASLALGESVTLEDGTVLTVESVVTGQKPEYGDGSYAVATVTIKNEGSDKISYASYNWRAVNDQGAEEGTEIAMGLNSTLDYGNLNPGGSVTGTLVFKDNPAQITYLSGLGNKTVAAWNVQ